MKKARNQAYCQPEIGGKTKGEEEKKSMQVQQTSCAVFQAQVQSCATSSHPSYCRALQLVCKLV